MCFSLKCLLQHFNLPDSLAEIYFPGFFRFSGGIFVHPFFPMKALNNHPP